MGHSIPNAANTFRDILGGPRSVWGQCWGLLTFLLSFVAIAIDAIKIDGIFALGRQSSRNENPRQVASMTARMIRITPLQVARRFNQWGRRHDCRLVTTIMVVLMAGINGIFALVRQAIVWERVPAASG